MKLGHVAIDGTKIRANAGVPADRSSSVGWNAGKHKAMSYKRMNETEARLKQEIDALLAAAEKAAQQRAEAEWKLVCAASNLLKRFRAGGVLEMA